MSAPHLHFFTIKTAVLDAVVVGSDAFLSCTNQMADRHEQVCAHQPFVHSLCSLGPTGYGSTARVQVTFLTA
jgi:hypothetical protein